MIGSDYITATVLLKPLKTCPSKIQEDELEETKKLTTWKYQSRGNNATCVYEPNEHVGTAHAMVHF